MRNKEEILQKIEGLQTIETIAETLKIKRQSAINLVSKLKKMGNTTLYMGGSKKRIYRITIRKQRKREVGVFDIINKYSPMKIQPWFDHQVHGKYGAEDALIDAIETKSFRMILASLRLFNHITDWPKLYKLAKEKNCWNKVGALYDTARLFFRVRKMPKKYSSIKQKRWQTLTQLKKINFPDIADKWQVYIPFNKKDVEAVI